MTKPANINPPHVIATPQDYNDLVKLARARMRQLNISLETLDYISGLTPRYSQKILGLKPEKRFGAVSLTAMMGALGLRLVVEEDQEALARIQSRLVTCKYKRPELGTQTGTTTHNEQT